MGLRDELQRLSLTHRGPGYRPLTALLRRAGWSVNHKRVLRLMRQDNLLCLRRRPFVPQTTDSQHGWRVFPNLARGMELTRARSTVGRRHHLRSPGGGVRLSGDGAGCIQRKVIGWALEPHLQAQPRHRGLRDGDRGRRPPPGSLVHHSDRGVQYACGEYTAITQGARHPAA